MYWNYWIQTSQTGDQTFSDPSPTFSVIVPSLTGLDLTKHKNIFLFLCTETTESKPVQLETRQTFSGPYPTVSIRYRSLTVLDLTKQENISLAPKSCCPVSGFLLSLTVPLSVIAYLWRLGWNPPKPRNEVIQISGWGGEFWSNKLGTEILVLKTIVLAMKAPCGAYLIPYSVFYVSNIKTFLVTGPTPIITIISQTITEQGPWWWSSGQHARLLLWPSEFESRHRILDGHFSH